MSRFTDSITDLPTFGGVYAIVCLDDPSPEPRLYVGVSFNTQSRVRHHLNELRRGIHHAANLQTAFTLYGENAFVAVFLERKTSRIRRFAAERSWWLELRACYNAAPPSGRGGCKWTDETRARRRKAIRTTRTIPDEERRRRREAIRIAMARPETRARASNAARRRFDKRDVKKYVVSPTGQIWHVANYTRFAREHGLIYGPLYRIVNGKQKTHFGWRAATPDEIAAACGD